MALLGFQTKSYPVVLICSVVLAVDLPIPQPGHDSVNALGEMPTEGTERQAEGRGGPFLGGGRMQIGSINGPPQLVVPRVLSQGLYCGTQQRLQGRRSSVPGLRLRSWTQAGPQ